MADTVLITGGGGFVGRHLAAHLIAEGRRVVPLDRAGTAAPDPELVAWELGARADGADALATLLREREIGAIVHLAGQSSAGASFADPVGTFAANVQGSLEVLEAVRSLAAAGETAPRTLMIGSAEEYGAAARPDGCREDDPVAPISPYGSSKAAATQLAVQYHRSFELPIIAVRPFSHTGPGHDERFVFPSFAAQIAAIEAGRSEPVLRVGNLSAARDFLDVRDVVRAYEALLATGTAGTIYNVCSGSTLTIADGLEILLGLSTAKVRVEPDPSRQRPVDIPVLVGDPSRLREATGWTPRVVFGETLGELLAAARRKLS